MVEQQPSGRSPSPSATSLLSPEHLYSAIAGHFAGEFPLVAWARELGDLHAELVHGRFGGAAPHNGGEREEVRTEIRGVVAAIDVWAARNLPISHGARMHTHSLGEVISHNAEVYAAAWWAVLHSADAHIRHAAWLRLSEAREGYVEMINETVEHRLRFPSVVV